MNISLKIAINQSRYTVVFGIASIVLGLAQYQVPGLDGVYSDLREIPLLIAIFHLRKPIFVLPLTFLTTLPAFFIVDGDFHTTFLMHVAGLFATWAFYQFLEKQKINIWLEVLYWVGWVVVYYAVLLFPIMLASDILQHEMSVSFFEGYKFTMGSSYFEIMSTTLVTSIYLVQLRARKELRNTNLNLESIVVDRTKELVLANESLKNLNKKLEASNEEITLLNENLEQLVFDRTERIKVQLVKLQTYAHSNSHEVRGPLARILGLINILEKEQDLNKKLTIINMVKIESHELDMVIRKMNRTLEDDDFLDKGI